MVTLLLYKLIYSNSITLLNNKAQTYSSSMPAFKILISIQISHRAIAVLRKKQSLALSSSLS